MHSYYDTIAPGYTELYRDEQLAKARFIQSKFIARGNLLDIGAGTGISSELFIPHVDTVTLLDPSKALLDQCSFPSTKIIGYAEHLPFPDKSFDTIISLTALHHCNLQKALAEIERIAKPGAWIAISILKQSAAASQHSLFISFHYTLYENDKDLFFIQQK